MPNQRGPNQTSIAVSLSGDLLQAIDSARKSEESRSAFIRDAIVLELRGRGVTVDPALRVAPDRVKRKGYAAAPAGGVPGKKEKSK